MNDCVIKRDETGPRLGFGGFLVQVGHAQPPPNHGFSALCSLEPRSKNHGFVTHAGLSLRYFTSRRTHCARLFSATEPTCFFSKSRRQTKQTGAQGMKVVVYVKQKKQCGFTGRGGLAVRPGLCLGPAALQTAEGERRRGRSQWRRRRQKRLLHATERSQHPELPEELPAQLRRLSTRRGRCYARRVRRQPEPPAPPPRLPLPRTTRTAPASTASCCRRAWRSRGARRCR